MLSSLETALELISQWPEALFQFSALDKFSVNYYYSLNLI